MTKLTQEQRVARALVRFKSISQLDFDPPNVCDHGKPIRRVAARVHDLREQGAEISRRIDGGGCAHYTLIGLPAGYDIGTRPTRVPSSASPAAPTSGSAPSLPSSADASPPARPRSAIFDDDWDEVA